MAAPDRCVFHRRTWHYWLAGVIGSFLAIEIPALRSGCHEPLSRVLSTILRCARGNPHRLVGPAVFLAFWSWLTWHVVNLADPTT